MAKSYNYDLTDEEYQLVYGSKRPVAEENKKQKVAPSLDLTEEELSFVYGADYGKSKEPASGGVGSSDVASAAPVQRREEQGLQPDRKVAEPWNVRRMSGRAYQFAEENKDADVNRPQNMAAQGISSLGQGAISGAASLLDTAFKGVRDVYDVGQMIATGNVPESDPYKARRVAQEFNEDMQRATDEMFPTPVEYRRLQSAKGKADGFSETLSTYLENPEGAIYEGIYQLAQSAPAIR